MCKCDCNSFGCGSRCDCNSFCCDNKCDCLIDNCNKIIKSVALQQTALSHILNAEGEKIQKIICSTDDVDEILKVNGSVNKTITQIISLEHILCSKLQIVKDLCLEDLPYKNSY